MGLNYVISTDAHAISAFLVLWIWLKGALSTSNIKYIVSSNAFRDISQNGPMNAIYRKRPPPFSPAGLYLIRK